MALLVHNQTTVVLSLCSLYHYHAEWPLKTDTWIKAGGCKPIGDMIRASLLLLHPKTSASCTGPLQWISRYLPRSTPRNEGRSAGTGSASRASFPGVTFKRHQRFRRFILRPFLHYSDTLKRCPECPPLPHTFPLSSFILSSQEHC